MNLWKLKLHYFLTLSVQQSSFRPGSDAVLHMSRIKFEFRPTQIINPGWIDSDAKLNSTKINTMKHIMTEENCRFVIIYAFDLAHVKYGIWIKGGPQLLFPTEPGGKNSWADLI